MGQKPQHEHDRPFPRDRSRLPRRPYTSRAIAESKALCWRRGSNGRWRYQNVRVLKNYPETPRGSQKIFGKISSDQYWVQGCKRKVLCKGRSKSKKANL